jgi:hypothetical protein
MLVAEFLCHPSNPLYFMARVKLEIVNHGAHSSTCPWQATVKVRPARDIDRYRAYDSHFRKFVSEHVCSWEDPDAARGYTQKKALGSGEARKWNLFVIR